MTVIRSNASFGKFGRSGELGNWELGKHFLLQKDQGYSLVHNKFILSR